MPSRCLLAIHKLEAFKEWLDAHGVEHRPTNADYQVLQVRLPGSPQWHAIFKKLDAKEHLSVPRPLLRLVEQFVFGAARSVDERQLKPVAEQAATTLPWE